MEKIEIEIPEPVCTEKGPNTTQRIPLLDFFTTSLMCLHILSSQTGICRLESHIENCGIFQKNETTLIKCKKALFQICLSEPPWDSRKDSLLELMQHEECRILTDRVRTVLGSDNLRLNSHSPVY